jgi:hypothetical protein
MMNVDEPLRFGAAVEPGGVGTAVRIAIVGIVGSVTTAVVAGRVRISPAVALMTARAGMLSPSGNAGAFGNSPLPKPGAKLLRASSP